jgi:hypothetical protein
MRGRSRRFLLHRLALRRIGAPHPPQNAPVNAWGPLSAEGVVK